MSRWLFVTVVFSILAVIPNGHAQVGSNPAKATDPALQTAIDARQKAIDAKNPTEWAKYTADNFQQVSATGAINSRADRMKAIASGTNAPNSVVIERVTTFGPDAAVTIQHNAGGNNNQVTAFWVRMQGTWKVVTTVTGPYAGK
jgi:hypothetical protein